MVLRAAEQLRNSSLSKERRTLETHVHSKANKSTEDRLQIKSKPHSSAFKSLHCFSLGTCKLSRGSRCLGPVFFNQSYM